MAEGVLIAGLAKVEPRVSELLIMGLDVGLPVKVREWKQKLEKNQIDPEMERVFIALGWLMPKRKEVG